MGGSNGDFNPELYTEKELLDIRNENNERYMHRVQMNKRANAIHWFSLVASTIAMPFLMYAISLTLPSITGLAIMLLVICDILFTIVIAVLLEDFLRDKFADGGTL